MQRHFNSSFDRFDRYHRFETYRRDWRLAGWVRLLQIGAGLLALLGLASPAFPGTGAKAAGHAAITAAPFLLTQVERELEHAPAESSALQAIYRRQVRSNQEAATFFQSASFLRLDLGGQRQVIDNALALDPIGFLPRASFLPLALREEYRLRAAPFKPRSL